MHLCYKIVLSNMCFAVPLKIVSINKTQATMEDGRKVSLSMVDKAKNGDWLMVQSNLAVAKLNASEAKLIRTSLKQTSDELND